MNGLGDNPTTKAGWGVRMQSGGREVKNNDTALENMDEADIRKEEDDIAPGEIVGCGEFNYRIIRLIGGLKLLVTEKKKSECRKTNKGR